MSIKWRNGGLIEDPPRKDFNRRELIIVSLGLPVVSGLFTSQIPACYHYPKATWADWLVSVILVSFVVFCWAGTIWFWVHASRRYRDRD